MTEPAIHAYRVVVIDKGKGDSSPRIVHEDTLLAVDVASARQQAIVDYVTTSREKVDVITDTSRLKVQALAFGS